MTGYEWVIEIVDEHNDIVQVNHADAYARAKRWAAEYAPELKPGERIEIGLVRDRGDEVEGLTDRQWAYVEDGSLEPTFDGGARVPERFRQEVFREEAWARKEAREGTK
jgi:hypothetical protein